MGLKSRHLLVFTGTALAIALDPSAGYAYIGPGSGLSAIGSLLALVVSVVVAIFGFIWFPIKRLLRRKKQAPAPSAESPEDAGRET